MNRKYATSTTEMDSGLGSDEDRRGARTKEEKQLHNQQLLSGCFIDAASLSDDAEIQEISINIDQRIEERRQGALLFPSSSSSSSGPHFSMLQFQNSAEIAATGCCSNNNTRNNTNFNLINNETNTTTTPFNSIVQLDSNNISRTDEEPAENSRTRSKSPLGFYVDLSQEIPPSSSSASSLAAAAGNNKKNIFSMVIDFEGPKKDKPIKLSSSYTQSYKINKPSSSRPQHHHHHRPSNNYLLLSKKSNGSLSSSVSSVNSSVSCFASTSQQNDDEEEQDLLKTHHQQHNIALLKSAALVKNLSITSSSSKSSFDDCSSDKNMIEKSEDESLLILEDCPNNNNEDETLIEDNVTHLLEDTEVEEVKNEASEIETVKEDDDEEACPQQFVKLSDIECQKPRIELNFIPKMSRSIPESHFLESSFLMSRSACYRSAPHPIEPESSLITELNNQSDSESSITNFSVTQPKKAVRRLGTDLLRMFLEEISPDVVVEVNGHKLKAHKCILASRCQYFAALLGGNWLEKNGNIILLQGYSYESVYFSLCHIYSGAAHVPDSISLVELASLADMLGLEGLKEVVEHALKQRHCHNFHKPCAGCCTGVLEVLPLSAAYGLDDLYQKCLEWITQNFVRVWPSRAFASLPRELREKCYQQHVVHMTPDKVLETMSACDKVLLPKMRWAESVNQLILQLTDACHLYHRQHFAAVLASASFHALDNGLGFGVCEVEEQMLNAAKNLGIEQACRSYARSCKMLDAHHWTRPFADLLNKIKIQLEQCLVNQADRLIRSNAWLRLDTVLRSRIKELTPSALEPQQSRLPLRNKKSSTLTTSSRKNQNSLISSSDSSRNSSPGMMNHQARISAAGSPSLRRSLLLAAKAPQQQQQQIPQSPLTNRKSTLTKPTAASQARSVLSTSKNLKSSSSSGPIIHSNRPPPRTAANANLLLRPSSSGSVRSASASSVLNSNKNMPTPRPSSSQNPSSRNAINLQKKPLVVSRNSSVVGKKIDAATRKSENKSNSPLKAASPNKVNMRSPSPLKRGAPLPKSPNKFKNSKEVLKPVPPVPQLSKMQRSSTFLKDEPTILGKLI